MKLLHHKGIKTPKLTISQKRARYSDPNKMKHKDTIYGLGLLKYNEQTSLYKRENLKILTI